MAFIEILFIYTSKMLLKLVYNLTCLWRIFSKFTTYTFIFLFPIFRIFLLKIPHFTPKMASSRNFPYEYFSIPQTLIHIFICIYEIFYVINLTCHINFVSSDLQWKTHVLPQKYPFRKLYLCIFLVCCQQLPIFLFAP